jgi:hypothetical protein
MNIFNTRARASLAGLDSSSKRVSLASTGFSFLKQELTEALKDEDNATITAKVSDLGSIDWLGASYMLPSQSYYIGLVAIDHISERIITPSEWFFRLLSVKDSRVVYDFLPDAVRELYNNAGKRCEIFLQAPTFEYTITVDAVTSLMSISVPQKDIAQIALYLQNMTDVPFLADLLNCIKDRVFYSAEAKLSDGATSSGQFKPFLFCYNDVVERVKLPNRCKSWRSYIENDVD